MFSFLVMIPKGTIHIPIVSSDYTPKFGKVMSVMIKMRGRPTMDVTNRESFKIFEVLLLFFFDNGCVYYFE